MHAVPTIEHVYKNIVFDSGRWARFTPRDGDVVVCTSYKAGTTWMQMICLLLIHQSPRLPAPLAELAPWLDMELSPIGEIVASLDAQRFRRVIKTHTPLDGLPYYPSVTYLFCGRDPRDVFMSLQNHLANADIEQLMKLMAAQGITPEAPPPLPDDLDERFRLWLTVGSFDWEEDGVPYWSHFHHAETFWAFRQLPNIHLLHYSDLKSDLAGQMRRVAHALGIDIDEAKWPELVKAATFEDMKANADRTAPDAHHGIWINNSQFFHKGENAQWRGALSDASLQLYDEVTRARYEPVLLSWLENGSGARGDPRAL